MKNFTWKYNNELNINEAFDDYSYVKSKNLPHIESDTNEPSSYSEIDILLDIHLWKSIKKYLKSNESINSKNIQNFVKSHTMIQDIVDESKHLICGITFMANTAQDNTYEIRELKNNYINDYRKDWYEGNVFSFETYRETYSRLYNDPNLQNILNHLEAAPITSSKLPYYWLEQLAICQDDNAKANRELIKDLKYINPHNPKSSGLLTCQLAIANAQFETFISQSSTDIAYELQTNVNNFFETTTNSDASGTPNTPDADFMNKISLLRNKLNSLNSRNEPYFGLYKDKGKKCSGLIDFEDNQYFSFSGPFDAYEDDLLNYLNFTVDKQTSNAELIRKITSLILPTLNDFEWAKFNKKVERFSHSGTSSTISAIPDTVATAMQNSEAVATIESDFSCCERKMFSYIQKPTSGDGFLFTKMKPCNKCIPAIKSFLNPNVHLRIYCLNDSRTNIEEIDPNSL